MIIPDTPGGWDLETQRVLPATAQVVGREFLEPSEFGCPTLGLVIGDIAEVKAQEVSTTIDRGDCAGQGPRGQVVPGIEPGRAADHEEELRTNPNGLGKIHQAIEAVVGVGVVEHEGRRAAGRGV